MRILHTEASLGWGGQEIRILRESQGMRGRGHEVFIFAPPESLLYRHATDEGFETKPVSFRRRAFIPRFLELKRFIEEKGVEIVNTHSSKDSWMTLPAARAARNRPLVLRTRHLSTPVARGPMNRLLYGILPHAVVTTGGAIRRQLISRNGMDPERVLSIPTGVDLRLFDPSRSYRDLREELGLGDATPLVGALSVLRSWKGLEYLVLAMPSILQECPGMRCVIAGEGPYRGVLERTIQGSGAADRIHLLGHRRDAASVLHSLDVVVHPSYAHEGVPQTVLQAMAMRRPVIASDIEPLREVVIPGETGILTPARDAGAIARAVLSLIRSRDEARRLGENGRRLVETAFSFDRMLDRLETLYAALREGF